jgi:hypothetical protein
MSLPNLIVKNSHSSFDFVLFATSSNVHPTQWTLLPIHNHKTKYENTFSKNGYIAPIMLPKKFKM